MTDNNFFSLDILPARKGDCLLLHYGTSTNPKLWIIDGGPSHVYQPALRPLLEDIRAARGLDDTQSLPVDLLMVSHIDDDHINGILELAKELREAADAHQPLFAKVDTLWHNAFDSIIGNTQDQLTAPAGGFASLGGGDVPSGAGHDVSAIFSSLGQGHELRGYSKFFEPHSNGWKLNKPFDDLVMMEGDADPAITRFKGVNITILGPRKAELEKLQRDWDKFLIAKGLGRDSAEAAFAAFGKDNSVSNLASIVALVECKGHSILFTGDALGKNILEALETRGVASEADPLRVDILKLQHHGSVRNATPEFFKRVKAKHYVFSGNGEHGNPERATLQMLLNEHDGGEITLHFSTSIDEIDKKRKSEAPHGGAAWCDATHALRPLLDTAGADGITVSEPSDRKGIRIDLLDKVES